MFALAVMSGLEGLMLLFSHIFVLCKALFVSIHDTASPSSSSLFQMETIYLWCLLTLYQLRAHEMGRNTTPKPQYVYKT